MSLYLPNEGKNKKVRITGDAEVKEITDRGLEKHNDELIDAEPKNKLYISKKNTKMADINMIILLLWFEILNIPTVNEENRKELDILGSCLVTLGLWDGWDGVCPTNPTNPTKPPN